MSLQEKSINLRDGWLDRQYEKAAADVRSWPNWMQREGGLQANSSSKTSNKAETPVVVSKNDPVNNQKK